MAQIIPVTLRRNKGSILTHDEMDNNLEYLYMKDFEIEDNVQTNTEDILALQNASNTMPDNRYKKEVYVDGLQGNYNALYIKLNLPKDLVDSLPNDTLLCNLHITGYLTSYNTGTPDASDTFTEYIDTVCQVITKTSEGTSYLEVFADDTNISANINLPGIHIRNFCERGSFYYNFKAYIDGHLTFKIKDEKLIQETATIIPEVILVSEPN